jgi:hypothetical protein
MLDKTNFLKKPTSSNKFYGQGQGPKPKWNCGGIYKFFKMMIGTTIKEGCLPNGVNMGSISLLFIFGKKKNLNNWWLNITLLNIFYKNVLLKSCH